MCVRVSVCRLYSSGFLFCFLWALPDTNKDGDDNHSNTGSAVFPSTINVVLLEIREYSITVITVTLFGLVQNFGTNINQCCNICN